MSDPLSSSGLRLVYNGLLLFSTGLAVRRISLMQYPFAFGACVVGGGVALLGLLRALFGNEEENEEYQVLRDVCHGVLELLPLPLVNMELYRVSLGMSPLVLAHGLCLVPMLFDLWCSMCRDRKNCNLSDTLRDLTVLANIVSLSYLAYRQRSFFYMRLACIILGVKCMPVLMDSMQENTGEDMIVWANAAFFYLLATNDLSAA